MPHNFFKLAENKGFETNAYYLVCCYVSNGPIQKRLTHLSKRNYTYLIGTIIRSSQIAWIA